MDKREGLAYIQVRKHKRIYKVFLKDLKAVIRRRKRANRPPVPAFDEPSLLRKDSNSNSTQDCMEF